MVSLFSESNQSLGKGGGIAALLVVVAGLYFLSKRGGLTVTREDNQGSDNIGDIVNPPRADRTTASVGDAGDALDEAVALAPYYSGKIGTFVGGLSAQEALTQYPVGLSDEERVRLALETPLAEAGLKYGGNIATVPATDTTPAQEFAVVTGSDIVTKYSDQLATLQQFGGEANLTDYTKATFFPYSEIEKPTGTRDVYIREYGGDLRQVVWAT